MMLDLGGNLSEVIDSMVSEQTGARFVGGLTNIGSAQREQSKQFSEALKDVYGPLADEIFGYLRLSALAQASGIGGARTGIAGFLTSFPDKTIKLYADKVEIDLEKAKSIIERRTNVLLSEFENELMLESLLPSELRDKKPELYKKVQSLLVGHVTEVNKKMGEYIEDFVKAVLERKQEVEDEIAHDSTLSGRIGLQEQLVQTVVDFDDLRSQKVNEMFLQQFGAVIELVLDTMFSGTSMSMAFKGSERDVAAFAKAVGGEKSYIEAAKKYGLNHPTTYKNKAKLNNAVKKFEKETGIKWPFK